MNDFQPKTIYMAVGKIFLYEKQTPITTSVSAYQDINKTLGNFYEQPKVDPEKKELKQKLEELNI